MSLICFCRAEASARLSSIWAALLPNMPCVCRSQRGSVIVLQQSERRSVFLLLSQVRGTLVVARSSSFEFKGKNESVREIGEQLNVNTVLGGSVRRTGNKLRITAQLTDAIEGFNLWSR